MGALLLTWRGTTSFAQCDEEAIVIASSRYLKRRSRRFRLRQRRRWRLLPSSAYKKEESVSTSSVYVDRGCLVCPNRRRRWRLPPPSTSTEEDVVSSSVNYAWPNIFASEVSDP
nr:hypothetical protein Iba_chr14aCG4250 [Ipomoea batatas]